VAVAAGGRLRREAKTRPDVAGRVGVRALVAGIDDDADLFNARAEGLVENDS
jgi:hypothetical protein